jgi:hypothetical protein
VPIAGESTTHRWSAAFLPKTPTTTPGPRHVMLLGLSHSGRRRPEETALTHPILVRSARVRNAQRE